MHFFVCTNCGFWQKHFAVPVRCPVCEDVRHTPPDDGYCFWTAEQAASKTQTCWREVLPGVFQFWCEPRIGIGPCGYIICHKQGNIAFEATGFYDQIALDFIAELGGLRWVAASHPHAYGAIWQLQQRFAPQIAIHVEDLVWTNTFAVTWPYDETLALAEDATLLHIGGHFAGHAVLYHAPSHTLFVGDALKGHFEGDTLIGISCHKAFNRQIPLARSEIGRYREVFAPLDFSQVVTTFELVPVGRAEVLRLYDQRLAGRPTCEPIGLFVVKK